MTAAMPCQGRLPATALTLQAHPAQSPSWPGQVQVRTAMAGSPHGPGVLLQFELHGDVAALVWPVPTDDAHTDGLWQHTCFEAFVGQPDQSGYHEFNFAPSGQWAAYSFDSERVRADARREARLRQTPPHVEAWQHADRATVVVWLPVSALPPHGSLSALRWNFTAVLETTTGDLSYWALTHPAGRPDFHHPAGRCWAMPPA